MKPSNLLFDILEHFEGLRLTAYRDSANIWTLGYGSTYLSFGARVVQGMTCNKEEAQAYLLAHLQPLINHINATIPAGLKQGQFDALTDFCYNAGKGAWDGSTLKKTVMATPQDFATITANFEMWDKAHVDGQLAEVSGLLRRRKCEAYLYKYGVNHPTFFE